MRATPALLLEFSEELGPLNKDLFASLILLASSPGPSQSLSRSHGEKSGEGLGVKLCHGPEMVDSVST